jgi:hypothetical protein
MLVNMRSMGWSIILVIFVMMAQTLSFTASEDCSPLCATTCDINGNCICAQYPNSTGAIHFLGWEPWCSSYLQPAVLSLQSVESLLDVAFILRKEWCSGVFQLATSWELVNGHSRSLARLKAQFIGSLWCCTEVNTATSQATTAMDLLHHSGVL